ncbi:uncharacterized protein LOC143290110 [Babylonia areolata]|uniref:uncharacterized protein LOC143290110 n=1 Tax=Babylonia areolata TaxID=304850 RepID=UPI003FD4F263
MMAATPEQKFNAAVKVIRGLPKNGSFQPSHELMLKFYAYFKQATEGPCTAPKPGIWNLVSRRKWEAWSELGQMDRESAMLQYVEELKNVSKHVRDTLYPPEIVETMPQTEQVAEFVDTLGAFYELIEEETKGLPAPGNKDGDHSGKDEADKLDHSACIGEMLKINNNDAKKDMGGEGDLPADRAEAAAASAGVTSNGLDDEVDDDSVDDDDDDDNGGNTNAEGEGRRKRRRWRTKEMETIPGWTVVVTRTSFVIPLITKMHRPLRMLQAEAPKGASTPMDVKRETRVRFAPHVVDTARSPVARVVEEGEQKVKGDNCSALLHNLSTSSVQMLTDRLALGNPAGLPFLPENSPLLAGHLSESLFVNNSASSQASLTANDSEADELEEEEEGTAQDADDDRGGSRAGRFDPVTSRGGGGEDTSTQTGSRGSNTAASGGAGSSPRGRRELGSSVSGGPRRGRLPPGSGGGGHRGGGEGQQGGGGLNEQILLALLRMRQDMTDLTSRLAALETSVQLHKEGHLPKKACRSSWWPFGNMSKSMVFLLIVWPFLAPLLINFLCRRRRHSGPR